MKRKKQSTKRIVRVKPRNPIARSPLLKKGAAHQLKNKRAKRAVQKARFRKRVREDLGFVS